MGLEMRDVVVSRGGFRLYIESLVVYNGEIVVVRGPNGSGKTTLLKTVAGLYTPLRGLIEIGGVVVFRRCCGEPYVNVPPEKRRVGYLPQNLVLFPHMSVYENIAYPLRALGLDKREVSERVSRLVRFVGLEGLEERMPHQLSYGQMQRVALARALAAGPRILLLDEPFSNIDQESRRELRRELIDLIRRTGVATLIVSHDPGDTESADRVLYLREGVLSIQ